MKTNEEVKKDLNDIKFYYSRKDLFDKSEIAENSVIRLAEKYNRLMKDVPPRLFEVYMGLYVNGNTQESMALDEGYTLVYVNRTNIQLIEFLKHKLNDEEKA